MSRGGIEPSTESACGGMDSKVARVIWEIKQVYIIYVLIIVRYRTTVSQT